MLGAFAILGIACRLSTSLLLMLAISKDQRPQQDKLPSSPYKEYSFPNQPKLQNAIDMYKEGYQELQNGKYNDACDTFMTGIFMGRSTVQNLLLNEEDNHEEEKDNTSQVALDWLISSYILCCCARIANNDYTKARADAWAACSYSQGNAGTLPSTTLQALLCMLLVCENSDDNIGELQTLRSIQPMYEQDDDGEQRKLALTINDAIVLSSPTLASVDILQERIQQLEDELFSASSKK